MKKSDLKDGMIVQIRYKDSKRPIFHNFILLEKNGECKSIGNLNDYADDLTHLKEPDRDIMKVYDCKNQLLWERDEIDWSKVECGTDVIVKDAGCDKYTDRWYAAKYIKKLEYPRNDFKNFVHQVLIDNKIEVFAECRLIKKVVEDPVTVEELYNKFDEKCCEYSLGCGYCDYQKDLRYKNCKWAWLLAHYNVTRKEVKEDEKSRVL